MKTTGLRIGLVGPLPPPFWRNGKPVATIGTISA